MFSYFIKGAVIGAAYADALGKSTEFMMKEDIPFQYKNTKVMKLGISNNDEHRNTWDLYDWTDDTDQSILVFQSINESNVETTAASIFAKKLYYWYYHGFPELGDNAGCGIGTPVRWVLLHPDYNTNPTSASYDVWKSSDGCLYEDGGIMRTWIIGVFDFPKDKLIALATEICQITHYDPRAVAACIFITLCVNSFIYKKADRKLSASDQPTTCDIAWDSVPRLGTPSCGLGLRPAAWDSVPLLRRSPFAVRRCAQLPSVDIKLVMSEAQEEAEKFIMTATYLDDKELTYTREEYLTKFRKYIGKGNRVSLEDLQLDNPRSRSNTKYPLICAVYSMCNIDLGYDAVIQHIVFQGGDSDTNACVAGAVLGAYFGLDCIPDDYKKLKHLDFLKNIIQ